MSAERPVRLAVVPTTGSQYVADEGNNRGRPVDASGGFVRVGEALAGARSSTNQAASARRSGTSGSRYGNNRIKKFDPQGPTRRVRNDCAGPVN